MLLALSGGALRRYLEARGELPDTSLLASVPVSVHGESQRSVGRNKVSSIFCRLGTDVADPRERNILFAQMAALMVQDGRMDKSEKKLLRVCGRRWAIPEETVAYVMSNPTAAAATPMASTSL